MKISARAIIEVAGFPKEHVDQIIKKVIDKLKEEREVVNAELFETVALKDKMEGFYSAFTELKLNLKDIDDLIRFCLEYMPSSIEIIEPEEMSLKTQELAVVLNDLLGKLHDYDLAIKNLQASNFLMKKKLDQV